MATMTMNIPVPKQSKPKPFVDPLRVKPKNGSVKYDPKDPRFRFFYILKYLAHNTAERQEIVEAMEIAKNDSQLVNLGQVVNNYTIHHNMIEAIHEDVVKLMIEFWKKKSINVLTLWTDPNMVDYDDYWTKRNALPFGKGGASYIVDLFEKCFEEAVAYELKGEYIYAGANWNLNGTLEPTYTLND